MRVSISGMAILAIFCFFMYQMFQNSIYSILLNTTISVDSLRHENENHYLILHQITCASSFFNIFSHGAVALGILNDTYVISILLGVGFDVVTRIIQLIWWMVLTFNVRTVCKDAGYSFKFVRNIPWSTYILLESDTTNSQEMACTHNIEHQHRSDITIAFLSFLTILYIYQMKVHVRALLLNQSATQLVSVLNGALNNLRGIPGEGYSDHLFAYTDLGIHLLVFLLCAIFLQRENESLLWNILCAIVLIASLSYLVVVSVVPLFTIKAKDERQIDSQSKKQSISTALLSVGEKDKITCLCKACESKKQRIERVQNSHKDKGTEKEDHPTSFTFNTIDGICQLWLLSFEELHEILPVHTKRI